MAIEKFSGNLIRWSMKRDAHFRKFPKGKAPGDRFVNGDSPGVLIRCPECSGDGTLHLPDEMPPSIAPSEDIGKYPLL